ncbi:MAG: c-type cytochrome biogenesis protein CcmI [Paracoccaceae bacterium]|jgi:cytochrome c-type biogenesis protein CcmH|nr:c-type cytochrome biogenesis protein CcmI [Paracoccaceae bacterium]MDP7184588.1 c-type cytochrome biogenesis protein CcmI [Paracoccaceae bacterium]
MIWGVMIAMAVAASAFLFVLLLGKSDGSVSPAHATLAILNDQLSEVSRDEKRGLISANEARAASQEIKRRILAQGRYHTVPQSGKFGNIAIVIAALFVPISAATYYNYAGSPDIASVAFADRQEEIEERRRIEDLTRRLAEQLLADPNGGALEGWMLLGQTYARLGRRADAADAYEQASLKEGADSVVYSMLAEALIVAEQGVITPKAERAIDQAILLDPRNPAGTYYKALAFHQNGQGKMAYDMLVERLETADDFAPWMETFVVRANIIAAEVGAEPISLAQFAPMMAGGAPGPTREDVEAVGEMSADEQNEFIRSMVARLADRLAEEPDDLDGWMRLGNAYKVLNEVDQAIDAYEKAQDLLEGTSSQDPRRAAVAQALSELGDQ